MITFMGIWGLNFHPLHTFLQIFLPLPTYTYIHSPLLHTQHNTTPQTQEKS
jgi:hypothetical protein